MECSCSAVDVVQRQRPVPVPQRAGSTVSCRFISRIARRNIKMEQYLNILRIERLALARRLQKFAR
jgi:hypothetical protein